MWILKINSIKLKNKWFPAVPDAPRQIKVKEAFPTGFLLEVNPPEEDGGEKISGYQVEYIEKDKIPTSGKWSRLSIIVAPLGSN